MMQRHAFALKIREGKQNDFRAALGRLWPDVTALLDLKGAGNFSLWNVSDLVFGYYETEQDEALSSWNGAACRGDEAGAGNLADSLYKKISDELAGIADWISSPAQEMRLMYQDFGIVRTDKSLIRHRVFATHLKGPQQEEYKRRHDALVEARGDTVNPGPDSNFSIWNASEYIFGYDEIDTSMETEETEESRAAAIAWETRMLEIMDWYTDDVDWITGLKHPHVICLAKRA